MVVQHRQGFIEPLDLWSIPDLRATPLRRMSSRCWAHRRFRPVFLAVKVTG